MTEMVAMSNLVSSRYFPGKYIVSIILLSLILSIIRGWNVESGVDDGHSLLESTGQIALQPGPEYRLTDEIQSDILWSHNNLTNVLRCTNANTNGNMSLFHIMLHYYLMIIPERTPLLLCSISIFSYLTTIYIIYYLTQNMFGQRAAMISGLLTTTNLALIEKSIKIRSYSLAITLSLLASTIFWQITQKKADRNSGLRLYISYTVVSILAFFTHFLTISILISHVIFALAFIRSKAKWISLSLCGMVFVLAFVAWGHFLNGFDAMKNHDTISKYLYYVENVDGFNMFGSFSLRSIATSLFNIVLGNIGFGYFMLSTKPIIRLVLMTPFIFTILYYFIKRPNLRLSEKDNVGRLFLVILLVIPLVFQFYRTIQYQSLYHLQPMYFVFQTPYLIILISCLIDTVYLNTEKNNRFILSYRHSVLLLWVGFILFAFTKHLIHTNLFVNSNEYYNLAAKIEDDQITRYQVNSLYDAQMISFYAGADFRITFVLSSQPQFDQQIKSFLSEQNYYTTMNYFMLYNRIAK